MKTKSKLFICRLISLFISLSPLMITLIINRNKYLCDRYSGIRLSFGIILIIVFSVIKALGKLKIPGRITCFTVVFVMSYLLSALLNDLTLLSGMALLGEFLEIILISGYIKKLEEKLRNDGIADAVFNRLNPDSAGNGRV